MGDAVLARLEVKCLRDEIGSLARVVDVDPRFRDRHAGVLAHHPDPQVVGRNPQVLAAAPRNGHHHQERPAAIGKLHHDHVIPGTRQNDAIAALGVSLYAHLVVTVIRPERDLGPARIATVVDGALERGQLRAERDLGILAIAQVDGFSELPGACHDRDLKRRGRHVLEVRPLRIRCDVSGEVAGGRLGSGHRDAKRPAAQLVGQIEANSQMWQRRQRGFHGLDVPRPQNDLRLREAQGGLGVELQGCLAGGDALPDRV